MIHTHTETTKINYAKLEKRLFQINDPQLLTNHTFSNEANTLFRNVPTLIVATGGSKAAAYYLKIFLETNEILCEVIEPRDYFYKQNIHQFKNLIILSNSGKTNGISDICKSFSGSRYLITSDYKKEENNFLFQPLYWSNNAYQKRENSFISIIPTLAPMLMFLELSILKNEKKKALTSEDLIKINTKLKELLEKSKSKMNNLHFHFQNTNLIQIISGYDTLCSSTILESNMIESGTTSVVIHDKGSFCHGRSNLIYQNPTSPIIYLAHQIKELDKEILTILKKEYPNIFIFSTLEEQESLLWKEYYLSLQMYELSRKIATDKQIDLTMPEYNLNVVKKLYQYKGEM